MGFSTVRALLPLVYSGLSINSVNGVSAASGICITGLMLKAELPTRLSLDREMASAHL